MQEATMQLKILLPFDVFATVDDVTEIVAHTTSGSCGMLPHRLDCVAALIPGILMYETKNGIRTYIAIDSGILVKTGQEVRVSVRNAIGGADLGNLQKAVESAFNTQDEQETGIRTVVTRLETDLTRRLVEMTRHAG
jgi:F-type H+-transporting ATPase subunit epsilon